MKHAKRIVGLVLCLALCLGLLAALGGARVRAAESSASGSLLRQFYTLFGRFSRYQSSTSLTGDQPKVVLTLGELEFEGLLIAPRIATLTDEEIDGVLQQTMAELGVNVEELNRAYERAIHLETRFKIEGIKKLRDYFAQYVPFGGVGVTVVRSIENGKLEGGAAGAVESASTDLLGTSLSLVSDGALGLAKNPSALVSIGGSAGSAALGAIGGYKEAKDNTRYEKFIKESDQMLALVARFYSLAFQRLTNLLEAKNKDNELRWNILFAGSPAKKQIGD